MLNIKDLTEKFSTVKVLVVGDVMLDRYWWGSVSRISPEAPVPVVRLDKTSSTAGGAANVAANIVGLNASATLVGLIGNDHESEILSDILEKSNISSRNLKVIDNYQTTVKTRIIAHNQQVVRLDQETAKAISVENSLAIFEQIKDLIAESHIVVVSDYAKGFLTDVFLSRLITFCDKHNLKVLVDPKGKDYSKYKGATLLTPNQKEAADACALEEGENNIVELAGKKLLNEFAAEAVLITQGERGMTLFNKNDRSRHFSALARNVYDVTGAGDTVIATLAVALGAGLDYMEAAELANIAAGLVVEQIGTTTITTKMLESSFN